MVVACVEIAVALSVLRSVAIETADDARENAEFLSSIVTCNPDLDSDCVSVSRNSNSSLVVSDGELPVHTFCKVRPQLQRLNGHILDCLWVEAQDAEVVDGIPIYWEAIDFFVVIEDAIAPERAAADDVAVGQNIAGEREDTSQSNENRMHRDGMQH